MSTSGSALTSPAPGGIASGAAVPAMASTGMPSDIASISESPRLVQR